MRSPSKAGTPKRRASSTSLRRIRAPVPCSAKLCDVGRDVFLDDIVAEHDHDRTTLGKMLAEAQRIGDSALAFLIRVVNIAQSKLRAVAEETKELTGGVSAGDDHDLHDAGRAERLQRIVDHRLVVNREQMFVGNLRQRAQPRAEPARQDNPLESPRTVRPVHARLSTGATRLRWRGTTRSVPAMPSSKRICGLQPRACSRELSSAYRRSCPSRSATCWT